MQNLNKFTVHFAEKKHHMFAEKREKSAFYFALTVGYYIWYTAFIASYYFLFIKKAIEQIYRNMCLLMRKLFGVAYLSVQNILFYN